MKAKLLYAGIRVTDVERSIAFYTGLLGMTVRSRNVIAGTGGTVVDLVSEPNGPTLELNYYPPGTPFATPYSPGEGLDHLGFGVPDVDAAIAEARAAGHAVVEEVRSGTSRWVYIQDPDGNWIELCA